MSEIRYSLCSNCDACPEVVIQDDAVLIGEEGNQAQLTHEEWNVLVAGVTGGALTAIGDEPKATTGCDCSCECC